MTECGTRQKGFLATEAMVAIVLMVMLVAAYVQLGVGVARVRDHQVTKRTLRLAAAGQMERYRAGAPIETTHTPDALPGITIKTSTTPGQGQWAGLTLVTVAARGTVRGGAGKEVATRCYLPTRQVQP